MNRAAIGILGVLGLSSLASGVSADWNEFWARFERDKRRNQQWPVPFHQADQQAVRDIFGVMIQRGWEEQLIFQDFHFDSNTQQLSPLGERKLAWALSQGPAERVPLAVLASVDPELDRVRMQNLQTRASQMTEQGDAPAVIAVRSRPAPLRGTYATMMMEASARAQSSTTSLQGQSVSNASAAGGSTASN